MALRDDLLPVFGDARSLVEGLGLRQNGLTIRTKVWTGPPGLSTSTFVITDLVITPKPKVREVTTREIASSGGLYQQGDLKVEKITPQYSGGGYTPAQIRPTGAAGTEIIYLVTGPSADECSLVDSDFSKNFGYTITIRRKRP